MPMKNIEGVVKNKYFTYFQVEGTTVAYRERNEIWKQGSINMKIQGDMPANCPGGTFNSFGKKHLLSAENGKSKTVDEKARKLVQKRDVDKAKTSSNRLTKLTTMRAAIGGDKSKNSVYANEHYAQSAYGKQKTDVNSVVLLDNFSTKDEVIKPFHDAIAAITDWSTTPKQHVTVTLGAGNVMTLNAAGADSSGSGIVVDVWYHDNIHYIYHLKSSF